MSDEIQLFTDVKSDEKIVEMRDVVLGNEGGVLLSGVNLDIHRGELVYLIGRSGSGKTTLMRSFYGDVPLQAGRATVCGFQLEKISKRQLSRLRRQMGIVFQNFRLLQDRNVRGNLEFILRATGWKKKKIIEEQIDKILAAVSLQSKADLMPQQLSEGEKQRVGIARALINNPQFIVADEPTGILDPVTSSEIMALLVDICKSEGRTALVSTHDFMMIDKYQSRVICCENGTVTVS